MCIRDRVGTVARADTDGQKLANMMIGKELTESQYEKVDASGAEVVASLDLSLIHISWCVCRRYCCPI